MQTQTMNQYGRAAFSLLVRLLRWLLHKAEGCELELSDSISFDGHHFLMYRCACGRSNWGERTTNGFVWHGS